MFRIMFLKCSTAAHVCTCTYMLHRNINNHMHSALQSIENEEREQKTIAHTHNSLNGLEK